MFLKLDTISSMHCHVTFNSCIILFCVRTLKLIWARDTINKSTTFLKFCDKMCHVGRNPLLIFLKLSTSCGSLKRLFKSPIKVNRHSQTDTKTNQPTERHVGLYGNVPYQGVVSTPLLLKNSNFSVKMWKILSLLWKASLIKTIFLYFHPCLISGSKEIFLEKGRKKVDFGHLLQLL